MTDMVIPSAEDLDTFSDNATDDYGTEVKEQALQQAADLLWLATKVTEQPTDERIARIVGYGILDMAWNLLVKTESKTEIYSPFSGEHIGSYSYQKFHAAVSKGLPVGIEWFDTAVTLLRGEGDGSVWVDTEAVFKQPYWLDQLTPWSEHDASTGTWWS